MRGVAIVLTVLLAGCAAPPAQDPGATPAPPAAGATGAQETAPEPVAGPVKESASAAKKAVERIPLAYHGTTVAEACPAVGDTEVCRTFAEGEHNPQELLADRRLLGLEAEVRWDAVAPVFAELSVVLERFDAGAWDSLADDGFVAFGPSPLSFTWDFRGLPEGSRLRLAIDQGAEVNQYPAAVVYAGMPQEFDVEGALAAARAPLA